MITDKINIILNSDMNTNGKYWSLIKLQDKHNLKKISKSNTKGLKAYNLEANQIVMAFRQLKNDTHGSLIG